MNQSQSEKDKKFDVGGQAVMEGVMMRSPRATAVTVRRPDGTMVTKLTPFVPLKEKHPWMGKPFIRGSFRNESRVNSCFFSRCILIKNYQII